MITRAFGTRGIGIWVFVQLESLLLAGIFDNGMD